MSYTSGHVDLAHDLSDRRKWSAYNQLE